jgi:AraC-like DNA-binding protein
MDEDLARINFISEMDHTQLGPGNPELNGVTMLTRNFSVGRLKLQPLFAGHTVLNTGWALLWVPLSWKGEYRFNGTAIDNNTVGLVTGSEGYFTRGEDAEGAGVVLSRTALHQDLSALVGLQPDELILPDGPLTISDNAIRRLREMIVTCTSPDGTPPPENWAVTLREEMLEGLLSSSLKTSCTPRDQRNEIIVRRAEEYFMSAFPCQPSLVELCQAAGVGKNSLYAAFRTLFNETPVSYFRKRRLSSARRSLVGSSLRYGQVKRVALSHGFTELGRFSTEYRLLFGELPSHTAVR